MKTTNALALSALLVNSLVAAYPSKRHEHLHKKRDLVVVTENVFETVYSTTTIWVDPTPAGGEFYEHPAHTSKAMTYEIVPSAVTSAEAASSTAQYVAPSSSSVYVAPSSVESPAPSSSTPAASSSSAPAVSSSSVYVAPSSAYVAPSSTEATSTEATSAAATSAAAVSTPSASTASTGNTYSGDVTYYNPAGGYGACGSNLADSDHVVAIPHELWDTKGTMSNGNPWCGVSINILNKVTGSTYTATIADKCMGCSGGDLDLPQGFFDMAFPSVDGRGKGVMSWSVAA